MTDSDRPIDLVPTTLIRTWIVLGWEDTEEDSPEVEVRVRAASYGSAWGLFKEEYPMGVAHACYAVEEGD